MLSSAANHSSGLTLIHAAEQFLVCDLYKEYNCALPECAAGVSDRALCCMCVVFIGMCSKCVCSGMYRELCVYYMCTWAEYE